MKNYLDGYAAILGPRLFEHMSEMSEDEVKISGVVS